MYRGHEDDALTTTPVKYGYEELRRKQWWGNPGE